MSTTVLADVNCLARTNAKVSFKDCLFWLHMNYLFLLPTSCCICSRLSRAVRHLSLQPHFWTLAGGSRSLPRPDGICCLSSNCWVAYQLVVLRKYQMEGAQGATCQITSTVSFGMNGGSTPTSWPLVSATLFFWSLPRVHDNKWQSECRVNGKS